MRIISERESLHDFAQDQIQSTARGQSKSPEREESSYITAEQFADYQK